MLASRVRGALLLGAISLGLGGTAQAHAFPGGRALLHAGALAAAAGVASLTLVSPGGAPVGGQWQQWVDEMRVPTIAGTLEFVPDNSACDGFPGCSVPATTECEPVCPVGGPYAPAITNVAPRDRGALYFELGHQFDWRYLTAADRRWFAWDWRLSHWSWWPASTDVGDGGLGALFSTYYEDCAMGENDVGSGIALLAPPGFSGPLPPMTYERQNACVRIDEIARRAGAAMEAARPVPPR
ncbi:MAG: hypothetical protein ACTHMY_18060 [Solirubrobacteraceae bacterium]